MVWYEEDIRTLESKLKALPPATDRTVFYGSSSIRLWSTLQQDFPQLNVVNLGFGGSTLAACAWFFERLIEPAMPQAIVLYAGDNDLGDGRNAEEVYLFFCAFAEKMERYFPDVSLTFLSIKISPCRWQIADRIRWANGLIKAEIQKNPNFHYVDFTTPLLGDDGYPNHSFFEADGLHLSPYGYKVWGETLRDSEIFNNLLTHSSQ